MKQPKSRRFGGPHWKIKWTGKRLISLSGMELIATNCTTDCEQRLGTDQSAGQGNLYCAHNGGHYLDWPI